MYLIQLLALWARLHSNIKSFGIQETSPIIPHLDKTVFDFCTLPFLPPSADTLAFHIFGIILNMALHALPFSPHSLANSFPVFIMIILMAA